MIEDFEKVKEQLKELAPLINSFKSESVQLKLIELLLAHPAGKKISDKSGSVSESKLQSGRKPRKPKSTTDTKDADKGSAQKKTTRGGVGAQATVTSLYQEGFFKSPQSIGTIVEYCGTNKGHHFKANEISPPLLRLLRDGKLKRDKNSDNQYEYTEA